MIYRLDPDIGRYISADRYIGRTLVMTGPNAFFSHIGYGRVIRDKISVFNLTDLALLNLVY